jgi:hypothetical protein
VGLRAVLDALPFKCNVNILSTEQLSTIAVNKSLHISAAAGMSDISDGLKQLQAWRQFETLRLYLTHVTYIEFVLKK